MDSLLNFGYLSAIISSPYSENIKSAKAFTSVKQLPLVFKHWNNLLDMKIPYNLISSNVQLCEYTVIKIMWNEIAILPSCL